MSHKGGVNGQALVQSMLESDVFGDFYKGLFDSHVGLVCGFFLKSKSMRESRRAKLERFRGCSEQADGNSNDQIG